MKGIKIYRNLLLNKLKEDNWDKEFMLKEIFENDYYIQGYVIHKGDLNNDIPGAPILLIDKSNPKEVIVDYPIKFMFNKDKKFKNFKSRACGHFLRPQNLPFFYILQVLSH